VDAQGNLLSHPMVRASGDCATDNETYRAVSRLGLTSSSSVGVVVLRQVVKLVELDLRKVRMMKMQEITITY
jgi:hypothetical protein